MTDSAIKYVGVDGCKAGWVGVGLGDDDGCPKIRVCKNFSDIVTCFEGACVILVDIPIGLCEDAAPRACDKEARNKLGRKRQSSVFPAPPRPFVDKVALTPDWNWTKSDAKTYDNAYAEAKKWHKGKFRGKRITRQAFGITRKIGELDEYLAKHRGEKSPTPTIREVHPEICFWALNEQQPMSHKKSVREGREERLDTLRRFAQDIDGIDVDAIFTKACDKYTKARVADNDILEALVAAITARIGCENGFQTLPSRPWKCSIMGICMCGFSDSPPKDSKGLPMEMVYAIPNDKGPSC